MSALSDNIERFICELFNEKSEVDVQRNALAEYFSCAPSQINYVLSTRFTLSKGYIILSRRGGGGYIRITKVDMERDRLLHEMSIRLGGGGIDLREAQGMIQRLYQAGIITVGEGDIMNAAAESCKLPTMELSAAMRSKLMGAMLSALMKRRD